MQVNAKKAWCDTCFSIYFWKKWIKEKIKRNDKNLLTDSQQLTENVQNVQGSLDISAILPKL